jgi:competence protein ComEC
VLVLFLVCLSALALAVNFRWRQRWFLLALVPLWLLISLHPFPPLIPSGEFSVTVLDVGQGDALFLSFPDRTTWLLDGGGGPRDIPAVEGQEENAETVRVGHETGSSVVGAYLRSARLKRIDNIWLSHAHQDHMAGLEPVLEEFAVGNVHVGWSTAERPRKAALLGWAAKHGIRVRTHTAGEKFTVGDVRVEILWPTADYTPPEDKLNNDSLVLRLCRFEHCLLLPGDIEQNIEKILASNPSVGSTALKVPHHGGSNAATEEFLQAVRPTVAIISVGARNPHGHPRTDTLARLETAGTQVFRTDRDGSVTLRVTREGISVRTFRQGQPARPYPNLAAKLVDCLRRLGRLE